MTAAISLIAVVAICLIVWRFADQATHPFSVHDLVTMDRISDAHAAPLGDWIVFTLRQTDLERNKGVTQLWRVRPDGKDRQQLTTHEAGSSHPRWAPDGRNIFFLSGRGGSSQVWRLPAEGGEAQRVPDLPLDVGCFALSRDGERLALSLRVFPGSSFKETKARLDEEEKRKSSGRTYDQLFVRHWDTWKDGRRAHLFVVPVAGGDPIDVTRDMDADIPSQPFGGAEEFTFTPDGQTVLFAARDVGREEAWSTRFDLFTAPADGSTPATVLIDGGGATLTNPTFSPDGKMLAYLAMRRPGFEADRLRIVLESWPCQGRRTQDDGRILTENWDHSAGGIHWSCDSKTIFTAADMLGQHPLFAVDVATGEVTTLFGVGRVSDIAPLPDRVVFGARHLQSPTELHSVQLDGNDPRPLTKINKDKMAATRLGTPEQFSFKGWNDEDVYCTVVKPVDFDPNRKYPVAFLIHGGPQGSFGNDFHYRWNPQTYAGAGYAAVMVDFHGSTGYGQAFTDAISKHWGDRPLEDLQKGLAAALGRYPWMDRERVAALGASYGGYMINWIHGVWNEPFRCFVCHDGNLDERMAYYDTEELWFPEWERGGPPWEAEGEYGQHNPIDHVTKWCKPTLVIHGQLDFRVVDTQGISTFTALQRRGVPSRFLYFPDENHWVLKPHNSIQWHEEVIGWLNRWCT
jgi:dipeptidyl aminopeptidase/acylaminoacyl peptidase